MYKVFLLIQKQYFMKAILQVKKQFIIPLLFLMVGNVWGQQNPLRNYYPLGVKIYPIGEINNSYSDYTMHGYTYSVSGNFCGNYPPISNFQNDKLHAILINKIFNTNYSNAPHDNNIGNINWEVFNDHSCNSSETGCSSYSNCSHKGIDFKAPQGTNVSSPFDELGEVVSVRSIGGSNTNRYVGVYYEKYDFTAFFVHVKNVSVSVGSIVNMGTNIAEIGSPNHLHLEVRDKKMLYAGSSVNSSSPLNNFLDARAGFMMTNSIKLNQFISMYGGSVTAPRPIHFFFKSNETNYSLNNSQIFEIEIRQGSIKKIIPNNRITVLDEFIDNDNIVRRNISLNLISSDLLGFTEGINSIITFRYNGGGASKLFLGSFYLADYDDSSVFMDVSDLNNWMKSYILKGAKLGLYKGTSLQTFNPSGTLQKQHAAKIIVEAGVRLGLLNINTSTSNGTFSDVNQSSEFFKHIQTLRNYGYIINGTNFNPTNAITIGQLCKLLVNVFEISDTDIAPTNFTNLQQKKIVPTSTDASLIPYMTKILNLVDIREDTPGFFFTENLWDFLDFSSVNTILTGQIEVDGSNSISRGIMAKLITNIMIWKSNKMNLTMFRSANSTLNTQTLDDYISFGEKYDNASITATSTPITPSQQTYSCASGGSITILYNPGSLPQHYYWSMQKSSGSSIATLTSNNTAHSSVTFTAPNVSTPTQWKLYTYTANNKGKARETFITINVGGTVNTTIPTPTNLQLSAYTQSSIYIEWDTVGFGITNYEVEYSQDPNFTYGTVNHTVISNYSTANWEPTGLSEGTYYVRVRAINSTGETSAWTQTSSITLNANSQPFISTVTPSAGTTITGNSVTLNFQAINGNAPLTYTVYFSTWNPQGNTPVATNISTPSFTVNNLTPNNAYFWAVKVVDADGDEYITNNFSLNTSPSTTVPNGTIAIENGATTTNSISVNLNVTATAFNNGTITGMRFSNDGVTWPDTWEQYNLNRPAWSLVGYGGTSTLGNKTVYAQFRDNSGNVSPTYSDNITLIAGAKGIFIVRDKTFESLRAANEYAVSGDIIYATAGYFDLTSEKGSVPYLPYTTSIGGGIKNGVSLIGEGADKTTLFWDGTQTQGLGLAGNNTIQGITFIVTENQNVSRVTLLLHGASNVYIKNCVFKNGDDSIASFNYYGNTAATTNINITNNLFINNGGRVFDIRNCNGLNIYNNTINNNGFSTLNIGDSFNLNIKNNIISNNQAEAVTIYNYSNLDFKNNNVFNNRFSATSPVENYANFAGGLSDQTGINGNISVDPLFVNSASNNYNLMTTSPCLNTGINVGLPFFGADPEIGTYELGGSGSITLNSNVTTSFLVTKTDGTQQTYNNGQTISNLPQGVYGIYPQDKAGYYPPNNNFVYLNINESKNYTGNYTLDTQGPEGKIYLNGDVYSSQSPYVTIFCDVVDKINGLQNGQMQFSNDGIYWTTPEPIKNKKLLWDLSNGNITNLTAGTKTVYAKFSDKNGYWSNIITDNIEYIPTGKIKIVEPNNNVYNLDFRNDILNAQAGDVLLLKEGIYSIFGGGILLTSGITFQGTNKINSKIYQLSAIDSKDGFKFDNLTLNATTSQNFYAQDIPNSKNSIFSNNIFTNESITNNGNNLIVANNVFKNISTNNYGFLMYYSNNSDSKLKVINNVFDASVNNPSLQTENGISVNGMCCGNLFEINNNNFINFDVLTTGAYNGGAIKYSNSNSITGDVLINNNNFFNCINRIFKYNGVDISKDKFSYSYNPNLNTDYSLPINSPLLNSGNTDLLYNDHNSSTNDIGITGGIYYNTPPNVSVTSEETGFNLFKFTANATDAQTPVNALQYRWDFNNDGIMDTPFLLSNEISRTITTATTDMIVCYVFDELFAIGYQIIPTPTASNISLSISQPQPTAICAGSSSSFQIIATGNFNQGNEFKVIYSGPNGDFSNPQFTQNLTAQPNGLIDITFPTNLPTCTTCNVKLVSTNPANSSNTALAAVYQAPQATISISPATTTICPNTNLIFTANPTNGGVAPTYTWKKNGVVVGSNSATYNATDLYNGDIIWAEMVSNQACASSVPVISTPTTIQVTLIDELFIQAIDNILAASSDVGVQWIRNGLPIEGANSQFYEASQTGFYQFSVTIGDCFVLSDVYQLTSLGIDNNLFENNNLSVYPNPTNDILNIKAINSTLSNLVLIDLQGRTILKQKVNSNNSQINLQNLPASVYLLQIETEKGKQIIKVVKK